MKYLLLLILLEVWSWKVSCCITSKCNSTEHPGSYTVDLDKSHGSFSHMQLGTKSPSAEDTLYITVIVSVSCALVIILGVLCVVILSAILAINANKKKKEKLSCEVITEHKNRNTASSLEEDRAKKKKAKANEDEWYDDGLVSPPLPARTAEMFILESLPSSNEPCSSSSTVTVTVDVEDSSDSTGSDDVFERDFSSSPKYTHHLETCEIQNLSQSPKPIFRIATATQQPRDPTPKSDLSCISTPKSGAHSYENIPKPDRVTQYENTTVVASHGTTKPPPIPPRPQHSSHTHTNHMTSAPPSISYCSQRAPTHPLSPSGTTLHELPEADRYDQGSHLRPSGIECDDDNTSEESLDIWPPLIPQQTKEIFVLLESGEEVEAVTKYSMDMTENVAYKTVGGTGNLYCVHKRNH